MSAGGTTGAGPVNIRAACTLAVICLVTIGLLALLDGIEGPASRCEGVGGLYMVGPGGETSCVDRHTFLPTGPQELQ